MHLASVSIWLETHPLSTAHVDCAVTVMLKILDGKCKMPSSEKVIMAELYQHIKQESGACFEPNIHALIASALANPDDEKLKMHIYEKRLLAETAISRPVMKQFKAYIRAEGLFTQENGDEEE